MHHYDGSGSIVVSLLDRNGKVTYETAQWTLCCAEHLDEKVDQVADSFKRSVKAQSLRALQAIGVDNIADYEQEEE